MTEKKKSQTLKLRDGGNVRTKQLSRKGKEKKYMGKERGENVNHGGKNWDSSTVREGKGETASAPAGKENGVRLLKGRGECGEGKGRLSAEKMQRIDLMEKIRDPVGTWINRKWEECSNQTIGITEKRKKENIYVGGKKEGKNTRIRL